MTMNSADDISSTERSICVFCGASRYVDETYFELARKCGIEIAQRKYRLSMAVAALV